VQQRFDRLFGARREQEPQGHVVRRPGRIVQEDLLDEAGETVLDFVDEAQLVRVDR
jgi:hypothetical protein